MLRGEKEEVLDLVLDELAHRGSGNRAHRGPVFLPWHRMFLRRLEEAIQAVTGDDEFALPYWDWGADGALAAAQQRTAPIWTLLGPSAGQVTQGPLAQFRVRLTQSVDDGRLYAGPPRPIWRDAGRGRPTLPDATDEAWTLADGLFDNPSWDEAADSFRNKLEGFQDPRESRVPRPGPFMHNRVHVWTGGDMAPGSSPNDPVFFLNHCNVDRVWEAWLTRRGRSYLPPGQGPVGHRDDRSAVLGRVGVDDADAGARPDRGGARLVQLRRAADRLSAASMPRCQAGPLWKPCYRGMARTLPAIAADTGRRSCTSTVWRSIIGSSRARPRRGSSRGSPCGQSTGADAARAATGLTTPSSGSSRTSPRSSTPSVDGSIFSGIRSAQPSLWAPYRSRRTFARPFSSTRVPRATPYAIGRYAHSVSPPPTAALATIGPSS